MIAGKIPLLCKEIISDPEGRYIFIKGQKAQQKFTEAVNLFRTYTPSIKRI